MVVVTCTDTGVNRVVFSVPALDCDSPEYRGGVLTTVYFMILVIVIGLPVFFSAVLFRAWQTKKLDDEHFVARFGPIFAYYSPKYFYWGVVALVRRTLLAVIAFAFFDNTLNRIQSYTIINAYVRSPLSTSPPPFRCPFVGSDIN